MEDTPKYISEHQVTSTHFWDNFLKQSKVKLLTRLCFGVSYFVELKFKQSFQESLCPFCNCRAGKIELCFQYFQCFKCFYSNASHENLLHLNCLKRIDGSILSPYYSEISRIFLFGDINFNFSVNTRRYCPKCHYYQIFTWNCDIWRRLLVMLIRVMLIIKKVTKQLELLTECIY